MDELKLALMRETCTESLNFAHTRMGDRYIALARPWRAARACSRSTCAGTISSRGLALVVSSARATAAAARGAAVLAHASRWPAAADVQDPDQSRADMSAGRGPASSCTWRRTRADPARELQRAVAVGRRTAAGSHARKVIRLIGCRQCVCAERHDRGAAKADRSAPKHALDGRGRHVGSRSHAVACGDGSRPRAGCCRRPPVLRRRTRSEHGRSRRRLVRLGTAAVRQDGNATRRTRRTERATRRR